MKNRARLVVGPATRLALVSVTALLGACGGTDAEPPIPLSASPSHASMFGGVSVTLEGELAKLGDIQSVTFDGIRALDVAATASKLTLRIQGAPTSGPARVVITGTAGQLADDSAFTYDPPVGGAPAVWAAFGASLTHGVQSGGLAPHGQLMSYAAQAARAAGVFLPPALVVDRLAPPLEPADFAKSCAAGIDMATLAGGLVKALTDPATQSFNLRLGRQDATLATRNFAVGGATVAGVLRPATGPVGILERVMELPDGDPAALLMPPLERAQVDRLEALDPDIAISVDLVFNDAAPAIEASDDLHPELMTPVSKLRPELDALAQRLGALRGQYFVGNLPPLDVLPPTADIRAAAIASGAETDASFDAKIAAVRAVGQQYNDALHAAVAPFPNLHIVDVSTKVQALVAQGTIIGGQQLTGQKFGGLVSLDFRHFTDTGYALLANMFIDAINEVLGLRIPEVDVAAVLANDALSPASLAAAGVHCPAQ